MNDRSQKAAEYVGFHAGPRPMQAAPSGLPALEVLQQGRAKRPDQSKLHRLINTRSIVIAP
jgi:hypothetical protein